MRLVRPLRSAHLPSQSLAPFLANLGQIHALEGRLRVQRIGLRIAGGNLGEHLGRVVDGRPADGRTGSEGDWRDSKRDSKKTSVDRGWNAFQELGEKELEREVGLIGPYHPRPSSASTAHPPSFTPVLTAHTVPSAMQQVGWGIEQDMHVISSIEVHEIFKRSSSSSVQPAKQQDKGKKVGGMTGSPTSGDVLAERQGSERAPSVQEKRKTLADYVNFGRMKVVRDNCQRSYGTSFPFATPLPFFRILFLLVFRDT
jgi:hypothetical protein